MTDRLPAEEKTAKRLELVDLFATYPEPTTKNFPAQIAQRREFAQTSARPVEVITPGKPLPQQEFSARYLSAYDRLALFWGTGSGKLCGAVSPAERFAQFERMAPTEGPIRGAIILVPGPGLEEEYYRQIPCSCAPGRYPTSYSGRKHALEPWYQISTWETFIRPGTDIKELSQQHRGKYVVLDEVHGLANLANDRSRTSIYWRIWRFLHETPDLKVVISTATPMFDQASQFAPVMNLILPEDQQLPDDDNYWATVTLDELEPYLRGRVSYVRTPETASAPVHEASRNVPAGLNALLAEKKVGPADGSPDSTEDPLRIGRARYDPTWWLPLSRLQRRGLRNMTRGSKFDYHERNLMTAVFPDGSVSDPEGRYIIRDSKSSQRVSATTTFAQALRSDLREMAPAYDAFFGLVGKGGEKVFCSFFFITDTGARYFSLALEAHGFERYYTSRGRAGTRTDLCAATGAGATKLPTKKRRYALITGDNIKSSYDEIFRVFNHPDNYMGEYIEILIGTSVLNEGYSMTDVLQVYTFHYHWNRSQPYQGESRAVRAGSHTNYRKRMEIKDDEVVAVRMYRFATYDPELPITSRDQTINVNAYLISLNKDISILRIMRMVKECAVDAILHQDRNQIRYGIPYTAGCDYTVCDYRSVATETKGPLVDSTYERYYLPLLSTELEPYIRGAFEVANAYTLDGLDQVVRPSFADLFPPGAVPDPFPAYLAETLEGMRQRRDIIIDGYGYPSQIGYSPDSDLYYLRRSVSDGPDSVFYYSQLFSQTNLTLQQAAERAEAPTEEEQAAQFSGLSSAELVEEVRREADPTMLLERALLRESVGEETELDAAVKQAFAGYYYRLRKPVDLLAAGAKRKSRKRKKINMAGINKIPIDTRSTIPVYIHFLSVWRDIHSERTGYKVVASYYNPSELRLLDPTVAPVWRDLVPSEEGVYQPIIQYLNLSKQLNFAAHPFFGLIMDDNEFRTVDTILPGDAHVDSRTLSRGLNCHSLSPLELADKLWYLLGDDQASGVPRFDLPDRRTMIKYLDDSDLYDTEGLGRPVDLTDDQLAQSYMIVRLARESRVNVDEFNYLYEEKEGLMETRFKYAYTVATSRTENEKCAELQRVLERANQIMTPLTPVPAQYQGPLLPR